MEVDPSNRTQLPFAGPVTCLIPKGDRETVNRIAKLLSLVIV